MGLPIHSDSYKKIHHSDSVNDMDITVPFLNF